MQMHLYREREREKDRRASRTTRPVRCESHWRQDGSLSLSPVIEFCGYIHCAAAAPAAELAWKDCVYTKRISVSCAQLWLFFRCSCRQLVIYVVVGREAEYNKQVAGIGHVARVIVSREQVALLFTHFDEIHVFLLATTRTHSA